MRVSIRAASLYLRAICETYREENPVHDGRSDQPRLSSRKSTREAVVERSEFVRWEHSSAVACRLILKAASRMVCNFEKPLE